MVPEVRRLVIWDPLLDRAFRRDDRLEGLDVEGRLWRRRNVDDSLPKSPEAEEEFDLLRAAHATDCFHGRVAAGAKSGVVDGVSPLIYKLSDCQVRFRASSRGF
jgi:hypothetical protein